MIAVVDSGGANLASIRFALERLGAAVEVTGDPERIGRAERVILPGVGAAGASMERIRERGLDEVLSRLTRPVLGICLGMQLLAGSTDEDDTETLGVLPGRVRRLEPAPGRAVPHMGWSRLRITRPDPLFDGIDDGAYVYFVHGYALDPGPETVAVAEHGAPFAAAIRSGSWAGVQFHPERSAEVGARVLANFVEGA